MATTLPVQLAGDWMLIEPGRIYVALSDQHMCSVEGSHSQTPCHWALFCKRILKRAS
jgi:chemotaxis response regulator CheB